MTEEQFRKAVQLVFAIGTPGRDVLDELKRIHSRPFDPDPYKTAFNLGSQDLVNFLEEMASEG
jgi:hypothetical protein